MDGVVIFGLGFIALGVLLLWIRDSGKRTVARWVPAAGIVIGHERDDLTSLSGDPRGALRYPIVRYDDASGREQQGRAVTATSGQRHPDGRRVGLRYDPEDPGRITLGGAPRPGLLPAVVAVVFIGFGLVLSLVCALVLIVYGNI
jgi:Protein of unknown function (DUF3592)